MSQLVLKFLSRPPLTSPQVDHLPGHLEPLAAMPSKFVAKAYVQNEVVRVQGELLEKIEGTKTEIIQQANELISAACDVDPGNVDGPIDFGNTAKIILTRMKATLDIHDEKLGILTESDIRRIVEGERGHDWASPRSWINLRRHLLHSRTIWRSTAVDR